MTPSQHILGFEWRHATDAWGTHQPVLYEAIKRTKGSVLELGSGYNSTPLIHAAAGPDRQVITADHDAAWLSKFAHLNTSNHRFFILADWPDIQRPEFYGPHSVVFVDEGKWESRVDSLKHFANKTEIAVLHDSDYLERELKMDFRQYYKWVRIHMPLEPHPYHTGPPTAIMSNVIDVEAWDIDFREYQHEPEQLG